MYVCVSSGRYMDHFRHYVPATEKTYRAPGDFTLERGYGLFEQIQDAYDWIVQVSTDP